MPAPARAFALTRIGRRRLQICSANFLRRAPGRSAKACARSIANISLMRAAPDRQQLSSWLSLSAAARLAVDQRIAQRAISSVAG